MNVIVTMGSFYLVIVLGLWLLQTRGGRVPDWYAFVFTFIWPISIPLALLARRYYGKAK